jgi:hypothetical protein
VNDSSILNSCLVSDFPATCPFADKIPFELALELPAEPATATAKKEVKATETTATENAEIEAKAEAKATATAPGALDAAKFRHTDLFQIPVSQINKITELLGELRIGRFHKLFPFLCETCICLHALCSLKNFPMSLSTTEHPKIVHRGIITIFYNRYICTYRDDL